jgi:formylglycine-generating enzyme required for sulfatase activity
MAAAQALEPEMVFVQGGGYRMGSTRGADDELPVHEVVLSDFYIGKFEVTQDQWDAVMTEDRTIRYFEGCDSCPVERISWNSVQKYIFRLNELTGKHYRLPTEAEWEYAARGGQRSKGYKYAGSNKADSVAWTDGNSGNSVHPIGQKKPNELGLYDMSGNVFEWCADWYDQNYYENSPVENPKGPETGTKKVIRGGSWFFDRACIRVTERDGGNPDFRYGYVGFRLCLPSN